MRDELTHWRDEKISLRHRAWGTDCPAVDIDWLMIEYDKGRPIGIIEYKSHTHPGVDNLNHPSYRAIRVLADDSRIPFIIAFYNSADWWFFIRPANSIALHFAPREGILLSERQYVALLYQIRGRKIPGVVLVGLNNIKPERFTFK